MHARVAEFVETAEERYGLTVDPIEFPEKGTPTAADAAEAVDCEIGQIVNSLVFSIDKSQGFLSANQNSASSGDVDESQRFSSANQESSTSGNSDAEPILCLTSGGNRVSEAALAEWAGLDEDAVSMASPELVREATGWAIGGVPPLCHATELQTLFDPALLTFDQVWAAAGTPTSMWAVDPDTLQGLADATVVDITE